jgi:hypothetical protein
MSDEEMTKFLSMYSYMANAPLDEIQRCWYDHKMKYGDMFDDNAIPEEFIKLCDEQDNDMEESANTDQIKQELRRKRKRRKKKKNPRKDTGDNLNMIDDISEFSRATNGNVIPRSARENNRSRRSSIISLQKSVPENVLLANNVKDVRSEASGSRQNSPPKKIHKQMTDRKIKANGVQIVDEQPV